MSLRVLNQLGLSDREIKVYTTLLKRGALKPATLAKAVNINRTTLYSVANKLISKGLIAEDVSLPTKRLIPNDPDQLVELLTYEKQQLMRKEKLIKDAVKELSLFAKEATHPIPKIQVVTEKQIGAFLFSQAKKWNTSAQAVDGTWWGFQDHDLVEQYSSWIHWLWKEVYEKDDRVKLFSNQAPAESKLKGKFPHRHIKILTDTSEFTATTWVVGNYIIMVFLGANPRYLIEIYDATMAQNMRAVFTALWSKNSSS